MINPTDLLMPVPANVVVEESRWRGRTQHG